MPKLKLVLDDLAVESFDPVHPRARNRGTVRGNEPTDTCFYTVYTYEYFCGESRDGSCDGSLCNGSCGPYECPVTYDATCPAACRTQGVYC